MAATKFFSLALLAALARAHVKMVSPVPFDEANLNNSPLDASGSDFPCKAPNYSNVGTMNTYDVGGKGQLQFIGSAVHGGGSCQVSVTYDNPPTADSVWKVITSIEGGCPARGAEGNIGDDAALPNPDTYDFTIPAIPAGEAILAWTWFNKVGNREMYMNCAPITISGTGTAEYYNSLPDMFKANIASETTCTTSSDTDVQFPDPGAVVSYENQGTTAFATPGSCTSTSGTHAEPTQGTGGSGDSGTATTTSAASEATVPGGVFMPNPSSSATKTTAAAPAATTTTETSTSGSGAALSGACTTDGMFNCVGGTQFQQCASGTWTAAQALAAGTKCTSGTTTNFVVEAA